MGSVLAAPRLARLGTAPLLLGVIAEREPLGRIGTDVHDVDLLLEESEIRGRRVALRDANIAHDVRLP